ncbi:hypothetical protein L1987_17452 [Smallanthus sonchifolius]|uniref:Uncharacterized protein n=1 Tax=Smallanthus sonchifolius TaxID=185202 RepID=A0ACB9IYZ7_9ASTR|nr:hypothetical protein L1987_17452 [Smallanthus sonchifolius]
MEIVCCGDDEIACGGEDEITGGGEDEITGGEDYVLVYDGHGLCRRGWVFELITPLTTGSKRGNKVQLQAQEQSLLLLSDQPKSVKFPQERCEPFSFYLPIMKLSLKLEDQQQNQNPILFKAKIPITVFGLPFLSGFSATHHHPAAAASDKLSLSLSTHFHSGPSLKLAYNTPTTTTPSTAVAAATAPLTLTLKSGISLSGSPNNSPLIISANFSFSPQNPNPNPTFSIKFTPRLGSFSLRKSIPSSVPNPNKKLNGGGTDGGENSYGFVPLDRPINWKELTVESATKDSIFSGIMMVADTELPVTKRVKVNLRWGVNIPSDYEKQLPYLRVNKIKIERIDDVNEEKGKQKIKGIDGGDSSEFEMLKGMYSWMSRELNDLQTENREMRRALEEIKSRQPLRHHNGYNNGGGGGKRGVPPVVEKSDGFEQWKMKKNGGGVEGNMQRETKKNGGSIDVESELQRAIKAASSQ